MSAPGTPATLATLATPATPAAAPSWFDAEDSPATKDLNTCIHCGL